MLNLLAVRAKEKSFTLTEPVFTNFLVRLTNQYIEAIETTLGSYIQPVDITGAYTTTTLELPYTCAKTVSTLLIDGVATTEYSPTTHVKHLQTDAYMLGIYDQILPANPLSWNFTSLEIDPTCSFNTIRLVTQQLFLPNSYGTPQTAALTEDLHEQYSSVEYVQSNLPSRATTVVGYRTGFSTRYNAPNQYAYTWVRSISTTPTQPNVVDESKTAADLVLPGAPFTNYSGTYAINIPGFFGFTLAATFEQIYLQDCEINFYLRDLAGTVLATSYWKRKEHDNGARNYSHTFQPHTLCRKIIEGIPVTFTVSVKWTGSNMGRSGQNRFGLPKYALHVFIQQYLPVSRPLGLGSTVVVTDMDEVVVSSNTYTHPSADAAETAPTLTNWTYPTVFPTLITYLEGLTTNDTNLSLANGYLFKCSSYNSSTGGVRTLFSTDANPWRSAGVGTGAYNKAGVSQSAYVTNPYTGATPSVYQSGGGFGNSYTSTLPNGLEIAGEFFEVTFPFECTLKSLNVFPMTGFIGECVGEVYILGSNDGGTTWETLADGSFSAHTGGVASVLTVSASHKCTTFRSYVITPFSTATTLRIQKVTFTLDTWATPPTPTIPTPTYALLASNITLPTSYTGGASDLTAIFDAMTLKDRRIPYTPTTPNAYMNAAHELLSSCYQDYLSNGYQRDMYDNNNTTFWASDISAGAANKLDGVTVSARPTQYPYSPTDGTYRGGTTPSGTAYYFRSTHDSGYADGEWFQHKFPYRVGLTGLSFRVFTNSTQNGPRKVAILGSNDGTTWLLLTTVARGFTNNEVSFGAYTNDATFNSVTFTELPHYPYIRIVVKTVTLNYIIVGFNRITYNVYSLTPS